MSGVVEKALHLAEGLLEKGEPEQAIAPLLDAALLAPDDPTVLLTLGRVYLHARRLPEAIASLKRAIVAQPTSGRAYHNLAFALEHSADLDGALAAQRQAVALAPRMLRAHGRLADLLAQRGRLKEAASSYERVYAAAPQTSYGLLCGARALLALDRRSEAEERLRALIGRESSSAEAHLLLGHLLDEAGRFGDAAASFERVLAIAPRNAGAYHGLVRSRRMTEADRPLVARITSLLDVKDLPARHRMTLHFSAGKALDDLGDYAGAIRHFDSANELRRRLFPLGGERLQERVDRAIARFPRELFASRAARADDDATPVLIVGMPRSGTTLIERVVSSHPRVAGGGELSYWNDQGIAGMDADAERLADAAAGIRDGYLRLLRGIGPDASRVTDKMPFNFLWIGLVHQLLPNARFVHVRRNPIDTCLSIYSTQFSFPWRVASDRTALVAYYRQYLRLMDHWRAVLPPDRLLDVDYEEATATPEVVARRLIAFCGLEWDAACLQPERNPEAVKTASMWQARQPIYRSSVERWRNYEPWLGELRELLPGA